MRPDVFEPVEAKWPAKRLTILHAPMHRPWLKVADVELNALD
jgi:hypothetical protein